MSFVKLHHKLKSWGWADDPNMVALWVRILLEANWKDEEWHGVIYERGSFPTSYTKLSQDTGISVQTVRTCLERMKKSGEVTCVSTNSGTKIIVNKWEYYQGSCDEDNMPDNTPVTSDQHEANTEPTHGQHETNTQLTTLIEDKNIRRVEDKEDSIKLNAHGQKPFQKPTIEEVEAYCIANGYTEVEAERFYNYYEKNDWTVKGKNGSRRKMKNWKLCINSWVVNEIRYSQTNDLRNRAREAYVKDVDRKLAYDKKKKEGFGFD